MITKLLSALNPYSLGIAIVYAILIAVLSLVSLSDMPTNFPSISDKVYHAIAYCILTGLWFLVFFKQASKTRALLFAFVFAVSYGILLEVLQDQLTTVRTLDGYDVLANTFGAIIAIVLISVSNFTHVKK